MTVGRTLGLLATVFLFAGSLASAAHAQSAVAIDAPLTGEVTINRDVEVRASPNESGRILSTLTKGKAVDALGTPRGSTWTQVGIGGVPLGYVPSDSLDPVYVLTSPSHRSPRSAAAMTPTDTKVPPPHGPAVAMTAAMVMQAAREALPSGNLQGAVVATRALKAVEITEKGKQRPIRLAKGQVLGLTGIKNGRLDLVAAGHGPITASPAGLVGVATTYPGPQSPAGPLYLGRLGAFGSYDDGLAAWKRFIAGAGAGYADRAVIVWPVFSGSRMTFEVAAGPMTEAELATSCAALIPQGYDCKPIALKAY